MRHRFHAICPYFAMFPETFVKKHLVWSKDGDTVLDPFSGRGTTAFESLLNNRKAIGLDINPVAVCISRAKVRSPSLKSVVDRIEELRKTYRITDFSHDLFRDEFFRACYEKSTLDQILFVRNTLDWEGNDLDCFIAALMLGRLHGESHRSPSYLSNRMPRTISTKPAYSVRWWANGGHIAPRRDVFDVLLAETNFRFASTPPDQMGFIAHGDVRNAGDLLSEFKETTALVITSPPYLDTTNFEEDQWLRRWFLGGPPSPHSKRGDHRHINSDGYWTFIQEAWAGIAPLLNENSTIVVRIGGAKIDFEGATERLLSSLQQGLGRKVTLKERHSSDIVKSQIDSFHPKERSAKREFDYVFTAA